MFYVFKSLWFAGAAIPNTGDTTSVWPFILLGVAVLLVAALVVLTIITKKK